ncbi:MAG: 3-methyl-2-oxobutanoate hydroxymethyltransferase [Cellvibrionales bacterium]|jgi:3-methyl-2-oxobutanoate hydroxymethyltransferase|nr:3-methyl-2-oxobutanoate hydroxymethyltransferase [Cellvibrionales bacterium]MBK8674950.1 3-methyl-2-oxobutanoate hydroxymethyltransferase [Cellvibrionales bacterium]HRF87180.1 3-methyl-2-oxobutanoate hydroxymethyltransferase [Pseudomonadales bacterium]HRG49540.1 3-methyl-2-oxobutanoate hydroxymethyltransferase [Pseudomonadales bacterium]
MRTVTVNTLQTMKQDGEKFAVLAAYDATFAHFISEAEVEVILVGDSLGMVVQGHDTTLPVTIEQIAYHTAAVKRGAKRSLIMSDMPFMSYSDTNTALLNATTLMQAGAQMVKMEGGEWLADTFFRMSQHGIPTCAHLGLTPQSVNKFGGYRVQGRDTDQAQQILSDAKILEQAGADLLVLECVPTPLATEITRTLHIPVIGIGAGPHTDAQVLVLYDMLGLTPSRAPKFTKNFLLDHEDIPAALRAYVEEVKSGSFPADEHSFR